MRGIEFGDSMALYVVGFILLSALAALVVPNASRLYNTILAMVMAFPNVIFGQFLSALPTFLRALG